MVIDFGFIYFDSNSRGNMTGDLVKLSKYGITCRTVEGAFVVTLKFDKDWTVIEPEDERVQCRLKNGLFYYAAELNNGGSEAVFKAIDLTIAYNETLARRKELLEIKVKELCELFADHDIEELETIRFTFDKRKRKKNKQTPSNISVIEQQISEEEERPDNADTFENTTEVNPDDAGMNEFITKSLQNENKEEVLESCLDLS